MSADHPHYRAQEPATVIRWDEPIEAVPDGGKPIPAKVVGPMRGCVAWESLCYKHRHVFFDNGLPSPGLNSWRIRNVAQVAQEPRTAPSGGEVGPEVVERMIALVRAVSGETSMAAWLDHTTEARAIVALLPEPVDADEA